MRIAQTSFLQFVAEITASAVGFLATIYFARELGSTVLGHYAVALAIVTWLGVSSRIGIGSAITKRMSEGEEPYAYFWAGVTIVTSIFLVIATGVFVFSEQVNAYVGAEVETLIVIMVLGTSCYSLGNAALQGRHLVHVYAVLKPLKIAGRAVVQAALVFAGFGLTGLLVGYTSGWILVATIAVLVLTPPITVPSRRHFRRLIDFAKYSWLGRVQGKTFSEADILILGALVSSSLVGVYSIAWALCSFFLIFTQAISTAMFPEISKLDADGRSDQVATLTNDAVAFAGFVLIPGIVGGVLVGDRVLAIYGTEFVRGQTVLPLLLVGSLLYSYLEQLLNTLSGIDRPDITFRVNGLFVGSNLVANVVLVSLLGWIGAAIGTALSAGVSLAAAYVLVRSQITFEPPLAEIGRQVTAAVAMAVVVYPLGRLAGPPSESLHSALVTVGIVGVGTAVYVLTMLALSPRFRGVVRDNVPIDVPMLAGQ